MGPLDGLWHLLNFVAPALGVAAIASALAKLLWHGELRSVSWRRLWTWAAAAGLIVSIAGLAVFGRDGKMLTYAMMVLACAAALWWSGFGARR